MSFPSRHLARPLALLVGLFLCGSAAASGADLSSRLAQRISARLEAADAQPSETDAFDLMQYGPPAIPTYVELLKVGHLSPRVNGKGARLSPHQRSVLLAALDGLPLDSVRMHLARTVQTGTDADARTALEILGAMGTSDDFTFMFRAATPTDPAASIRLGTTLERELYDVLLREEGAAALLASRVAKVDLRLQPFLVRAIGRAGTTPALIALSGLLNVERSLDYEVLSAIGRVAETADIRARGEVLGRVRWFVRAEEPGLQREAALCLGKLEDFDSVPDLITMMRSDNRGLAESAHWALTGIAGKDQGDDVEKWASWYDEQQRWLRDEYPVFLQRLRSDAPGDVALALRSICMRWTLRHEIATDVMPLLGRKDARLRSLACNGLGQLGSRVAVNALTEALHDDDERVARSARNALRAILGPEALTEIARAGELQR